MFTTIINKRFIYLNRNCLPFINHYISNQFVSPLFVITENFNIISTRYLSQSQKNSRHNNNEIDVTDVAALESSKNGNKVKFRGKTPELPKVYLRDENNRLLGLMTMIEAEKLAQKHKKVLIQIDGPAKKFMSMKFADIRFDQKDEKIHSHGHVDDDDQVDANDHNDEELIVDKNKKKASPKIMAFTSKVSEHDLQTKINQVKKFLLRGQETLVKIVSMVTDGSKKSELENIFHEFESIFNESSGCRINQKRLTDRDLKFNILISDIEKAKQKLSSSTNRKNDKESSIQNLDNIDPHKLLEEDTESILNKK